MLDQLRQYGPGAALGVSFYLLIRGAYAWGAVVFGLLGIWWVAAGLVMLRKGWRTKRWSQTEGTVIQSELEEIGTGLRMKTRARILYTYEVGGRTYKSMSLFAGDNSPLSTREGSLQERLVDDYPRGATVQVFYNHDSPGQSVLEPGAQTRLYVAIVGGLLAIFWAVFLYLQLA